MTGSRPALSLAQVLLCALLGLLFATITIPGRQAWGETPEFEPPSWQSDPVKIFATAGASGLEASKEFRLTSEQKHKLTYRPWVIEIAEKDGREIKAGSIRLFELEGAKWKRVDGGEITLEANKPKLLDFQISQKDIGAGDYLGNLEFRSEATGTDGSKAAGIFSVPVVVKVKAGWLIPALLLAVGLAVGWGLTWYRKEKLPEHQLILGIQELEEAARVANFVSGDAGYDDFASAIRVAKAAVLLNDLNKAEAQLKAAKTLLIDHVGKAGQALLAAAGAPQNLVADRAPAAKSAKLKLELYYYVSYALALALLAAGGFHELYVSNKIFGSNGIPDYIAVFVWGFGSQATTQALGQMVQSWNLPAFNKPPAQG